MAGVSTFDFVDAAATPPIALSNVPFAATPYTISNLEPNKAYQFTVTPRNLLGEAGTTVLTNSARTLATPVSTSSLSNLSYDAVRITWNAYSGSNVSVAYNEALSIVPYPSTTYDATLLLPNTEYAFEVTPYNDAGEPSASYAHPPTYTLPYLSNVLLETATSSNIQITLQEAPAYSGSWSNVSITWTSGVGAGSSSSTPLYPTKSLSVEGLQQNVAYTFTFVPYNAANQAGMSITKSASTRPPPLSVDVSFVNESILFTWSAGVCAYVNLEWWPETDPGSVQTLSNNVERVSVLLNSFPQGRSVFKLTPFNAFEVPGTPKYVYLTKTASITAWSD